MKQRIRRGHADIRPLIFLLVIMTALAFTVGFVAESEGRREATEELRNEAIKLGYAERIATGENKTEFRWIKPTQQQEAKP